MVHSVNKNIYKPRKQTLGTCPKHPNLTVVHLKLHLVQFKGHSGDERRSTKNVKASIGAIESMIDPRSPNDTSGAVKSCTVDVFLVHARL